MLHLLHWASTDTLLMLRVTEFSWGEEPLGKEPGMPIHVGKLRQHAVSECLSLARTAVPCHG